MSQVWYKGPTLDSVLCFKRLGHNVVDLLDHSELHFFAVFNFQLNGKGV